MTQNLPATTSEETALARAEGVELHADHHDPQHQQVQQNVAVALLPLALIVLLLLSFVAAAWTFLAAQGA
jgi:hypothetical protein